MARSYKRDKPKNHYDYLIIGSGMSGISLAAMLAREGKSSLILERHYEPGGFTHTFKRRDYEWDVGVHYIGQVHQKGSTLDNMFQYVTDGSLKWAEMDDIYDRIFIGEESFDFVKGTNNFVATLKQKFPDSKDQRAIDNYLNVLKQAVRSVRGLFMTRAMPPFLVNLIGGFLTRKSKKFSAKTTLEVLQSITDNKKLIAVLTGQYGDYGLPPGQSSFLMHAMLANHYLNGGSYPVGGSSQIFKSIEPVIEAAGGAVFTNAEVQSILVEHGKAVGVLMADGAEIRAGKIISSVGLHLTLNKLLDGEPLVNQLAQKLDKLQPSTGHLCLYVGFKEPQSVLQLPKTNFWIYPENPDHDENLATFLENPEAEFPLVYISFPSAKDPEFEHRYPGRSTLEIITLGDYDRFKQWEGTEWKHRGYEYESMKERIAQRLLGALYRRLPHLDGKVDYYELSTPLSTKNFVNYQHGEIYGLSHNPERFLNKNLSVHTPVKNLYLTGQDLVSCGIAGAMMSAMTTAIALEGTKVMGKVTGKSR
jgi:all-trans-retinol 13,14-reductase